MTALKTNELSRPIAPEKIGEQGRTETIEADSQECERLAERIGLNELISLTAEIILTPQKNDRIIHLNGHFTADIQQTCVVTLEPIKTRIEANFERLYDTTQDSQDEDDDAGETAKENHRESDVDAEEDDPPEPLMGGKIDVGEAIAEQLALEINPFPRKPGIEFAEYSTGKEEKKEGGKNAGAFSGLAALKKKLKK